MTLKAARMAGMIGENGEKRRVRLISEPEAAAMHCLRFYQDTQNSLQVKFPIQMAYQHGMIILTLDIIYRLEKYTLWPIVEEVLWYV